MPVTDTDTGADAETDRERETPEPPHTQAHRARTHLNGQRDGAYMSPPASPGATESILAETPSTRIGNKSVR